MGLTFPWETLCLDLHRCYFRRRCLGGASVLRWSRLHAPLHHCISLQPQSHLDPCILNENAKAMQSVLHMEPELQAACLGAAEYLYYQFHPARGLNL